MIFLDTSAIYALADDDDSNHKAAADSFRRLVATNEEVLVTSYVVVEAAALLQRRLGLNNALDFLREAEAFQVHWVSQEDHMRAVALLAQGGRTPP